MSSQVAFIRQARDDANAKTLGHPKYAFFNHDRIWGKAKRARMRELEQRRLDDLKKSTERKQREEVAAAPNSERLQTSPLSPEQSKPNVLPSLVKDRFAQDRRRGVGDNQNAGEALDGHLEQRWVSKGTTNFAGPNAPWAGQGGFEQQTFPMWDESTVKMQLDQLFKPIKRDHSQDIVNVGGELSVQIPRRRVESTLSWAKQKYGISVRLPLGQAAAVIIAAARDHPVCSLGKGCMARSVLHFREFRHVHIEDHARSIIANKHEIGKKGSVASDGFLVDGGEQKRCVLKDEINHDNRAKDWDVMKHFGPVVRRPLALPGCTWGKVNVRPLGFYEGYVKTGTVIAHGRGTMMWRDGNIYRGEWRDGMMHGEVGEFYNATYRTIYKGNWRRGRREGRGKYWYEAHAMDACATYEGGFQCGQFHGQGDYTLGTGRVLYRGQWFKDMWHGRGKIFWSNGRVRYDGNWEWGEQSGFGTNYRNTGKIAYAGHFEEGKYHGTGKFHHPPVRKGLHPGWCSGTWTKNQLTGPNCSVMFDGLDTCYMGNVERGRIVGYGKVSYLDHRVAHGLRKRVRLPLLRFMAADARSAAAEDVLLESEAGFSWRNIGREEGQDSPIEATAMIDGNATLLDQEQALQRKRKKREKEKRLKEIYRTERRQKRDRGEEGVSDSSSEDENDTDYDSGGDGETGMFRRNIGVPTDADEESVGNKSCPPPAVPLLRGKGTVIYPDDSRYDGYFINGSPNGLHGFKVSPSGQVRYGTFENGQCQQRESVEGISWRLIVYKCKGYRSGSRIRDKYMPMSATAAIWLWFAKQEPGTFGGDRIMNRFGETARMHQLKLVMDVVEQRTRLCGTIKVRSTKVQEEDEYGKLWVTVLELDRGLPNVSGADIAKAFRRARGDTVWPPGLQKRYRKLVQVLRTVKGGEDFYTFDGGV